MAQSEPKDNEQIASTREMGESIWVAIVLAFVLRAFVLEAFVIPTGSMAPRLMGKHWQFDCPACKYHYSHGTPRKSLALRGGQLRAACPNCRSKLSRTDFDERVPRRYGGDRVLVLKYLYRFREPAAWDVVVFKNPQDNEQNYIKRLIGRPGQMIEIVHGDIFVCEGSDRTGDGVIDKRDFDADGNGLLDARDHEKASWRILRKSPETQKVMWQVVFDNDYQPAPEVYKSLNRTKWESPWRPSEGDKDAWKLDSHGGRVFDFTGNRKRGRLQFGADGDPKRFYPAYAYNNPEEGQYDEMTDVNTDLKLSFMFVPKAEDSRVALCLSSFHHHFRAWVGADGHCRLEYRQADKSGKVAWDDKTELWGSREDLPPLQIGRGYEVSLTHVDHQVSLWLNGEVVLKTTDQQYKVDRARLIKHAYNDPHAPDSTQVEVPMPKVAILAEGGRSELWHVKLMRDVFYTCVKIRTPDGADTGQKGHGTTGNPIVLRRFFDNPDMDEFFVLGDNSPQSQDGRMWFSQAPTLRAGYQKGTVPRYVMIGKAFFVYWPGGYRIPLLEGLPIIPDVGIVPNVGRMRLIR